jgi:hypothetical protein
VCCNKVFIDLLAINKIKGTRGRGVSREKHNQNYENINTIEFRKRMNMTRKNTNMNKKTMNKTRKRI